MRQIEGLKHLALISANARFQNRANREIEPQMVQPSDNPQSDLEPLLTPEDVARRLSVSRDWVWDHSSRKSPYLPVIRVSGGVLRYRASQIEEFVSERERVSALRRRRR